MDRTQDNDVFHELSTKVDKKFDDGSSIILHECLTKIISKNKIPSNFQNPLHRRNYDEFSCKIYTDRKVFQVFVRCRILLLLNFFYKSIHVCQCDVLFCKACKLKRARFHNLTLFNLYRSFYNLLRAYRFLELLNEQLSRRLKTIDKSFSSDRNDRSLMENRICISCCELQQIIRGEKKKSEKLLNSSESANREKEKMVVKYAAGEKRVFELQRSLKTAEKKLADSAKERENLQKKNEKLHDHVAKITREINCKHTEIIQLQGRINYQRDEIMSKKLKIEATENKLQSIVKLYEESQKNLRDLQLQVDEAKKGSLSVSNNNCDNDNLDNRADNLSECLEDSSDFKETIISDVNNEIFVISAPADDADMDILPNVCDNVNANPFEMKTIIEDHKQETKLPEARSEDFDAVLSDNENLKIQLGKMEEELTRITKEYSESQEENKAYQQREHLMLDYTQKILDKNHQIQCENQEVQTKIDCLLTNKKKLYSGIHQLLQKKKVEEYDSLKAEYEMKNKFEVLLAFVSRIMFQNRTVIQCLCDLHGEHLVLRKKYETILRHNSREPPLLEVNKCDEVC